jgi:hypothetical protein
MSTTTKPNKLPATSTESPIFFEPRQKAKTKTRSVPRCSIKFDVINPVDFQRYNFTYCCEQCSHYDPERKACTLGYNSKWHRRESQLRQYEVAGSMALCRFLEID